MRKSIKTSTLTRAEVYQLAVFWFQQPDTSATRERLFAINRAIGRQLLGGAQCDAATATELGYADGERLANPQIKNPDALCADFDPTGEERQALAALYKRAAVRCRGSAAGCKRILARWPKAA
jgi:hypothetical protein